MEIAENDFIYNDEENKIIDRLVSEVVSQLGKSSTAIIYKGNLWNGESFHKVVGGRFKKKGYYVAYNYVPNGYQSLMVSKMPIGESGGRMVTRVFA